MGTTIAALEKMGIVARQSHPTDGRQVKIELTVKGAALRKNAEDAKVAWLERVVARLDEEEQKTLFAAGNIIQRLAKS